MKETKASGQETLIWGIRPLIEAFLAGKEIDRVYLQKGLKSNVFGELWPHLKESKVPFTYVPSFKLDKMAPSRNHQGVVAQISPVRFQPLDEVVQITFEKGETPLLLILDRITDVRNFGAIIRTAECAGVHGIIFPDKQSSPVSGDAAKTSAGALMRMPLVRTHSLVNAIEYLQQSGFQVIAATEKTDDSLYSLDLKVPTAIVMGSEEDGVSPGILKRVDGRARIPLMGDIGSLNVSVAAGILLYEVIRQRTQKQDV
ncbi:MAG: 23S rRNA (guanosine(2251)-2'-O)-methyltransferase RlmB [Bacteroidota bacterium]|nr:23S rRNA (guanosine(2251)-2'-O)-methyltransferase RlmB [Bacteroidota bacterium]MDX5426556.1 23S rRNA (guanosine(2251)-2'-O)-methyltransferase RlmB [Bacteroidota bacterium]MDX5447477.1 23S rRNA (guanosine(2251)-2'-O)-methyltransferase RlmB [Bacteroidota bacterium]MDX5504565.1 23S rRNA (guanosine(2251)-2'-O)-methyltransferase RlmB [Bacteroidota bacterium]